jgi:arylsulfatase
MQDPFERADITSNTFWDWQLNHIGSAYGMMDDVFQFVATFKEFPPRSFPPSFNPANVMESVLNGLKEDKRLKDGLDLERLRGGLNKMIEDQLRERGRR